MEFALILRELSRRRSALAVGLLIAAIAATFSVYHLEGGTLKARALQYSSASTQVFVDTPSSILGNLGPSFEPLQARANVYANFMASPTFLNLVGQRAGIDGERLYAAGPIDPSVPRVVQEPTAVERNVEITGETTPYRLNFNSDPNLPTIGIYAQAPTTPEAIQLANASAVSLEQYVTSLETSGHTPPQSRVVIRQLGQANGGVVNGGISKSLAAMAFIGVFVVWCILVLLAGRFRDTWRASAKFADPSDPPSGHGVNADAVPLNGKASSDEHAPEPARVAAMHARIRPSGL
jgi:hypothetical protein